MTEGPSASRPPAVDAPAVAVPTGTREQTVFALGWAVLVGFLVALGISRAPASARKLFLTPMVCGAVVGFAVARLTDGVVSSRAMSAAAALITVAALGHVAWLGYGELRAAATERLQSSPQQLLGLRFLREAAARDPSLLNEYEENRLRLAPTFGDYVLWRFAAIRRPGRLHPYAYGVLEVILGAAVAVVVASRTNSRQDSATGAARMWRSDRPHSEDLT